MEEEGQKEVENVTKSPKSGVTIAKKVANIVLDVVVVAVLLLALFTIVVTVNAKKSQDKDVSSIFGYQLRFVQSGSMGKCAYTDVSKYKVKSIKVKSCVFIKTAPTSEKEINEWYKTLKVGDVLTFQYNKNDGSAAPEDYEGDSMVITHRVIRIEKKENGNGYIITLKGDYKSGKDSEPAEQVIDTEVDTPAKTTYIIYNRKGYGAELPAGALRIRIEKTRRHRVCNYCSVSVDDSHTDIQDSERSGRGQKEQT